MLFDSFVLPDHPSWHTEYHYSPDVALALHQAYEAIKLSGSGVAGFDQALHVLEHMVWHRMSYHQRLHTYYILTTGYTAADDMDGALCWLDRALRLALSRAELDYQIDLLVLRASLHRAILKFTEAEADLADCLTLLDARRAARGLDEPAARLQILPQQAIYQYFLERFELAIATIQKARELVPLAPERTFDAAAIEWVQAKLQRARRELGDALRTILAVHEVYAREASTVTLERLEIDVAEIALEWAETLPRGADRRAFLAIAQAHLRTATRLAREAADLNGQGLIRLAQIHYNRVAGGKMNRLAQLEAVIRDAEDLRDPALLAQAHTAMGDELRAHGKLDLAFAHYRATLAALAAKDIPVLATPARRALLEADEQRANAPTTPLPAHTHPDADEEHGRQDDD